MMTFHQAAYLNLGNGVRLVGIYDTGPDGHRSAHVLRTEDDGDSWICLPLAMGDEQMSFNETALAANAEGHVIALMRTAESPNKNQAGFLYQATAGVWERRSQCLTQPFPTQRSVSSLALKLATSSS